MKPSEFIHPEDVTALRQLECIPGFPALLKKFLIMGAFNIKTIPNGNPSLIPATTDLICQKFAVDGYCGSKLPDNARFCSNCGSPLS